MQKSDEGHKHRRTRSSLNLAGSSAPRWGMCRSPINRTSYHATKNQKVCEMQESSRRMVRKQGILQFRRKGGDSRLQMSKRSGSSLTNFLKTVKRNGIVPPWMNRATRTARRAGSKILDQFLYIRFPLAQFPATLHESFLYVILSASVRAAACLWRVDCWTKTRNPTSIMPFATA